MANLIDTDAKVITPGNYGYGHPTVVSFDDGTLFAGFINDLGDLEVHKSINNGSSWTLNTTITPSTGIEFFNLCYRHTISVDELFVLYSDGINYKLQKRDDGGSWSQVYNFSSSSKSLARYNRSIDRLYIATNSTLYYSDNGGSSFSSTSISGDTVHDFDIYPNNNIIICYDGAVRIYNSSGSFISSPGGLGSGYKWKNLLVNSANNWLEIGYDSATTQIEMAGLLTDIWSVTINNLIAGMDGDDNIYVFYTKTSDEKVYYRKYDGSWGSETLLVASVNNKFNCEKHSIPSSIVLNYMYYTA